MWRASLKVKNTAPITRRYIEWLTLFVFYKQNNVCLGSMLSKKSFLANERNVLAPLVRPTRGNVRDHIESHKSDRRPSYMPCRGLRRRRQRKTDLREIFGAAQFSTFSTASVNRVVLAMGRPFPVIPD
jgi:hypothetical protein